MSDTVLITGILCVVAVIIFAVVKGHRLKKIKFEGIEATFSSESKSLLLIIKIPDRVAWLDLNLKLNGKTVRNFKARDQGGQKISKEIVVEKDGESFYTITAKGSQRLYNAAGQLKPLDYNVSGSGNINIVFGQEFIIHEVADLGSGGASFSLCLENYENYKNSLPPDDIAEADD